MGQYREFGRAEPALKLAVGWICGWEHFVLIQRPDLQLPTVTRAARSHPLAALLILAGLAWHFRPLD